MADDLGGLSGGFTFKLGMDAAGFKGGLGSAAGAADKLTQSLDKTDRAAIGAEASLGKRLALGARTAARAFADTVLGARRLGSELPPAASGARPPVDALSASAQRLAAQIAAAGARSRKEFAGMGAAASGARPGFFSAQNAARALNGALVSLGAAAGLGLAFRASIQESLALEKALAEVATLVDTARVPIQQITADVRTMAASFGVQGVEATQALYQAISAGVEPTKAVTFLKDAALLATAGLSSLKETTDLLTNALNAYGLSADKAGALSDVFFATVKDGKTTVPQLAAAVGQVAPLAANAGVSINELSAAAAALTSTGLTTSQAMTGVRGVISGVIKPTAEAKAAAAALGIEFSSGALAAQGLEGFLGNLRGALESASQRGEDTTAIVSNLFGQVEAGNAVLSLTGAQFGKFSTSLENNKNALGATDKAAKEVQQTVGFKLQKILAVVKDEAGKFGAAFMGAVGDLIGFGGGVEGVTVTIRGLGTMARATFHGLVLVAKAAFEGGKVAMDAFVGGGEIAFNKLKAIALGAQKLWKQAFGTDAEVAKIDQQIQVLEARNALLAHIVKKNAESARLIDNSLLNRTLREFNEANQMLGLSGNLRERLIAQERAKTSSAAVASGTTEEQLALDRSGALARAQLQQQREYEQQALEEEKRADAERLAQQKGFGAQVLRHESEHGTARLGAIGRAGFTAADHLGSSLSRAYRAGIDEAQPALQDALSGAMRGVTVSDSTLSTPYASKQQVHQSLFGHNLTGDQKAATISALASGLYGFNSGGEVPGTGSGDKVMAKLEPGEFVVRRQVAQRNMPMLRALNSGGQPGEQGPQPSAAPPATTEPLQVGRAPEVSFAVPAPVVVAGQASNGGTTVNRSSTSAVTNNVNRSTTNQSVNVMGGITVQAAPGQDARQIADVVIKQIERRAVLGLLDLGGRKR